MSKEIKNTEKIKVESEWKEDLCWCPSQLYLQLTFEGRFFILYCRWRHSDPWSATLIECDADYYMHNKKYEWIKLEIDFWRDMQISEVKENSLEVAKKIIYQRQLI